MKKGLDYDYNKRNIYVVISDRDVPYRLTRSISQNPLEWLLPELTERHTVTLFNVIILKIKCEYWSYFYPSPLFRRMNKELYI